MSRTTATERPPLQLRSSLLPPVAPRTTDVQASPALPRSARVPADVLSPAGPGPSVWGPKDTPNHAHLPPGQTVQPPSTDRDVNWWGEGGAWHSRGPSVLRACHPLPGAPPEPPFQHSLFGCSCTALAMDLRGLAGRPGSYTSDLRVLPGLAPPPRLRSTRRPPCSPTTALAPSSLRTSPPLAVSWSQLPEGARHTRAE